MTLVEKMDEGNQCRRKKDGGRREGKRIKVEWGSYVLRRKFFRVGGSLYILLHQSKQQIGDKTSTWSIILLGPSASGSPRKHCATPMLGL